MVSISQQAIAAVMGAELSLMNEDSELWPQMRTRCPGRCPLVFTGQCCNKHTLPPCPQFLESIYKNQKIFNLPVQVKSPGIEIPYF